MIRVGTAGWSYADWEGPVYPPRSERPRAFHALPFLARYFDCVELNASYYAVPRADAAARWVELVADRPAFRFTAKLHRAFTHDVPEPPPRELAATAEAWLAGVEPLRASGKLAAVLVQLPRAFRYGADARERLRRIAEHVGHLPLAVELRHRSWFEPEGLDAVDRLGMSLVALDLPEAPHHPPREVPRVGPLGYLRVHGRNAAAWRDPRAERDVRYDYLYAPPEVEELAERTRRLATGRDETYAITNNHFRGQAVANGLELLAALASGDAPPLAPGTVVDAFPRLAERVRVDPDHPRRPPAPRQGDLFG